MSESLKILVSASLNIGKSVGDLNDAIKAIEKHPRLKKINLKIDIDQKFTQSISKFISSVEKMKRVSDEQNRVVEETITQYKRLDGSIEKVSERIHANGEFTKETIKRHDENKKSIKAETDAIDEQVKSLEDLLDEQAKYNKSIQTKNKFSPNGDQKGAIHTLQESGTANKLIVNTDKAGNVTGYQEIENQLQNEKKILAEEKRIDSERVKNDNETAKIRKSIADKALKDEEDRNKEFVALHRKAFDDEQKIDSDRVKNANETAKIRKAISDKRLQEENDNNKRLDQTKELELYKKQAELNVKNVTSKYKDVDTNSINDYLQKVKMLQGSSISLQRDMRNLNTEFKKIETTAKLSATALGSSNKSAISFGNAIEIAATKFAIWGVVATGMMQTLHFFTDGIAYVNDLNKSLTEISIVTGKSQKEVTALGLEYNSLAKELKVTTRDVASASVEFYRQGLTQEQVMNRVRVATQYAKISNMDFKESAELLTATVNSMGVDIQRASDVFSFLGDATATSSSEIGQAFQRVGGSAGALKIEFEKVASWIAVLSSRTREGAGTIGNSIKSILARVQNITETGFDEEDGTTINQVAKALNEVKISLIGTDGQFRNFGSVMDDLGNKWKTLDSREKAYISTVVAGTYQQSKFLNLMEGYQDTIPLYDKALESAGATTEKYGLYAEGTAAHIDGLKASIEGLWQNIFDSEAIRSTIDGITAIVSAVDWLIVKIGGYDEAVKKFSIQIANTFSPTGNFGTVISILATAYGWTEKLLVKFGLINKAEASPSKIVPDKAKVDESTNALNKNAEATSNVSNASTKAAGKTKDLGKYFDEATKDLKTLNQALKDVSEGQSLSGEATADLILQYPELSKHIIKTADGYRIEESALKDLQKIKLKKAISDLENEKKSSLAAINASVVRITAYQNELDAIEKLENAKSNIKNPFEDTFSATNNIFKKVEFPKTVVDFGDTPEDIANKLKGTKSNNSPDNKKSAIQTQIEAEKKKLEASKTSLQGLKDQTEALKKLISDPDFGTSGDGKPDKEKKEKAPTDVATFRDLTKEHISAINAEAEAQKQLNDVTADKVDKYEKEKKYALAIKESNTLLKGQQSEITKLNAANNDLNGEKSTLQNNHKGYNMSSWLDDNGEATEAFGDFINGLSSKKQQDDVQRLFDRYKSLFDAVKSNKGLIDDTKASMAETIIKSNGFKTQQTSDFLGNKDKAIEEFDRLLKKSEQFQSGYKESSKEYVDEENKQIAILNKKKNALHTDNDWIRARLEQNKKAKTSEKMTADSVKLLTDQLEKNSDAWFEADGAIRSSVKSLEELRDTLDKDILDAQNELKDHVSDMADDIIDIYKDVYEAQKKLLDNELKKYEEIYDARMKLIDNEEASEDYKRKLLKLQDEQTDIQKDLNVALLNDDISNKKRRAELEKSLADKTNEINEMKHEYETDLRKDSLQNDLDTKKKEIEAGKNHIDDLINDEKRFAEIKKEVMSGVFTTVLTDFGKFKTEIGTNSALIGETLSINVIDKISKMESQITTSSVAMGKLFTTLSTTLENTFVKTLKDLIAKLDELNGKKVVFEFEAKTIPGYSYVDEQIGYVPDPTTAELSTPFVPPTPEQLEEKYDYIDDLIGYVPSRHTGGTVGEGTPVSTALHEAFNLNKNEKVMKLLNSEVVINPVNFKPRNFLQDILSNVKMPNFSGISPAMAGGGSVTNQLNINIENMNGSQREVDSLSSKIVTGLHKMGVKI